MIYEDLAKHVLQVVMLNQAGQPVKEVVVDLFYKSEAGPQKSQNFEAMMSMLKQSVRFEVVASGNALYIFEQALSTTTSTNFKVGDVAVHQLTAEGALTQRIFPKGSRVGPRHIIMGKKVAIQATEEGLRLMMGDAKEVGNAQASYVYIDFNMENGTMIERPILLPTTSEDVLEKYWVFNNWIYAGFDLKTQSAVFFKKMIRIANPYNSSVNKSGDSKLVYHFVTIQPDGSIGKQFEKEVNVPEGYYVDNYKMSSQNLGHGYIEKLQEVATEAYYPIYKTGLKQFGDIYFDGHSGIIYSFGMFCAEKPESLTLEMEPTKVSAPKGCYLHAYQVGGEELYATNQLFESRDIGIVGGVISSSKPSNLKSDSMSYYSFVINHLSGEIDLLFATSVLDGKKKKNVASISILSFKDGELLRVEKQEGVETDANVFKRIMSEGLASLDDPVLKDAVYFSMAQSTAVKMSSLKVWYETTLGKLGLDENRDYTYFILPGGKLILADEIRKDGSSKQTYVYKLK